MTTFKAIIAATALAGLTACTGALAPSAPASPAQIAEGLIVSELVGMQVGGVTIPQQFAVPIARCVVQNATPGEIATIAASQDATTRNAVVNQILLRQQTQTCAVTALTS